VISIESRFGRRRSHRLGTILAWVLLSLLGTLYLGPFLWMVSSSLKGPEEIYAFPPDFIPNTLRWSNYLEAWNRVPFGRFFLNSALVTVATTLGVILTSSLGGYSFARLRYPGRDTILLMYLGTMMIPFPVLMIPAYILMRRLSLVDTLWGLIIPGWFSAWGTFLMRQYMLTLPREVEEAARVDGASFLQIYWRIILPLSTPVIATLGIFTFLGAWNDFLWPLIMISSIDKKTVPLGLVMFQSQIPMKTPWHLVMAAATFSMLPVLIIFVLGQKYYVRGIALSGLKGG
jgi:multiple sugar transport system permease protein